MALHYFVSDVHLGLDYMSPAMRERRFVSFLKSLPEDTESLYLLGDIFDFWYEYRYVVPAGYVRVLGALASLVDKGIRVYYFRGNHDLWTFWYLEKEIGLKVLEQPSFVNIEGSVFCLGHGDGLGSIDAGFKLLRTVFYSKTAQKMFSAIHPRWAFALARCWSRHNRLKRGAPAHIDVSGLPVFAYAESVLENKHVDYFVFGHFHSPQIRPVGDASSICILGEWVYGVGAAVFDGKSLRLIEHSEN